MIVGDCRPVSKDGFEKRKKLSVWNSSFGNIMAMKSVEHIRQRHMRPNAGPVAKAGRPGANHGG